MIDLYSSLTLSARNALDMEKVHNVIYMVLKSLHTDDNSIRLQALKILRLLFENHSEELLDISSFFFTVSQV
jgi:hypothetical protein